jgi:hypothetical protein
MKVKWFFQLPVRVLVADGLHTYGEIAHMVKSIIGANSMVNWVEWGVTGANGLLCSKWSIYRHQGPILTGTIDLPFPLTVANMTAIILNPLMNKIQFNGVGLPVIVFGYIPESLIITNYRPGVNVIGLHDPNHELPEPCINRNWTPTCSFCRCVARVLDLLLLMAPLGANCWGKYVGIKSGNEFIGTVMYNRVRYQQLNLA